MYRRKARDKRNFEKDHQLEGRYKRKLNWKKDRMIRREEKKELGAIRVFVISERYQKFLNHMLLVISVIVGFLGAIIYGSSKWVLSTWTNLNLDELIFHLKVPVEGTNSDLIADYFNICVASAIIIAFAIVLVLIGLRDRPKFRSLIIAVITGASIWAIVTSINLMWDTLNVNSYIENQKDKSTFIQSNYVDPRTVELTYPEEKQNLIFIFLESMETTYMDYKSGGEYEYNYIPELTQLSRDNTNFSDPVDLKGAYTSVGASWTMGGLFAQTSGLPLKLPIEGNSMNEHEEFFPDISTLGDILDEAGYNQELLVGSDATFGGRRNYFEQHGQYKIFDYNTAKSEGYIPEDYYAWWGYEDEKLFSYAQSELLDLAGKEEPFNFTMLTADTHFEDGYVCADCTKEFGDNQYANVLSCSSRKVFEFVTWIQQQEFYKNTSIVLVGDHLTMDSDFCESIENVYDRRVYTTIINPAISKQLDGQREYTTMDMFPTTLACLGIQIKGERLGLGTNLFSTTPSLAEKFGIKQLDKELAKKSDFFDNFTKNIIKKKVTPEIVPIEVEPIETVPVEEVIPEGVIEGVSEELAIDPTEGKVEEGILIE